jgi:hypothetical protein
MFVLVDYILTHGHAYTCKYIHTTAMAPSSNDDEKETATLLRR